MQIANFCGLAFALFWALLCAFVCFYERPRLERPRLGTPDYIEAKFGKIFGVGGWGSEIGGENWFKGTMFKQLRSHTCLHHVVLRSDA